MLGRVWQRIDAQTDQRLALREMPARDDLQPANLEFALGRRWCKDHPQFWQQLSPLHRRRADARTIGEPPAESAEPNSSASRPADDLEAEAFMERVRGLREAEREELRRDLEAIRSGNSWRSGGTDLRPSGTDGLMLDPEDKLEEERWR
jgi:hypothetical protein